MIPFIGIPFLILENLPHTTTVEKCFEKVFKKKDSLKITVKAKDYLMFPSVSKCLGNPLAATRFMKMGSIFAAGFFVVCLILSKTRKFVYKNNCIFFSICFFFNELSFLDLELKKEKLFIVKFYLKNSLFLPLRNEIFFFGIHLGS